MSASTTTKEPFKAGHSQHSDSERRTWILIIIAAFWIGVFALLNSGVLPATVAIPLRTYFTILFR